MANGEEPGEEQPKSGIDRINDTVDNIRRAKNDAQNVQKGARFAQKGAQAIRAGAQAIRAGTSAAQGASAAAGMMGGAEGGVAAAGAGAAAAGAAEGAAAGAAAEGAAVATGATAAGGTVEFWGPIVAIIAAILLLVFVFIVIFAVIFQPPPTNGGTLDCGTIGGTCTTGTTCAPPSVQDTTGATCNPDTSGQTQICCVPSTTCASIGGACSTTTCVPPMATSTKATCDPTASGQTQTCCTPQSSLHFYCQYDDNWTAGSCRIRNNGCTPTSVAMILASFGKTNLNPLNVALANGGGGCFDGGVGGFKFYAFIRSQGYKVNTSVSLASGSTFHVSTAQTFLSQGCFLLAAADMTYRYGGPLSHPTLSSGPHATVITAIDSSGVATVADPTWCLKDTNYALRSINVYDRSTIYSWMSVVPVCP